MSTASRQVIGTAALEYNEQGHLEAAVFYPKIKVKYEEIKDQLESCANKTLDDVKNTAQLLLATFFNKINEIELRDMEKTSLQTKVVRAENHSSGLLKEIELEFILTEKATK